MFGKLNNYLLLDQAWHLNTLTRKKKFYTRNFYKNILILNVMLMDPNYSFY